ncbi:MAG TPA: MBL fold metallo-hydrolase [Terriglobales bacterium]|nr:MBL fold metallo-hydrolase [Terriglobales bacterium]
MFSVTVLGSGSSGNATLVATGRTRVLIDAGFSHRELRRRLALAECGTDALDAVLITHEHTDHVAGLPRLAAAIPAPVYCNQRTLAALGDVDLPRVETFFSGETFAIGDFEITPFSIPHDAADPVGFRLVSDGLAIVIVTDLGYLPENVKDCLRSLDCLIIESNHDLEMLKGGGYSWQLKQRVLSRTGHLSNDGLGAFLQTEFDGHPRHLVLAHLSQNNNLPELARLSAERALAARGARPQLDIAPQDRPLPTIWL